jgi:hypothetical protein
VDKLALRLAESRGVVVLQVTYQNHRSVLYVHGRPPAQGGLRSMYNSYDSYESSDYADSLDGSP